MPIYVNRAAALSLIKNAGALADNDMAIRLDPAQPVGYVNRGRTSAVRATIAAVAAIDKAPQLAPGFPSALEP